MNKKYYEAYNERYKKIHSKNLSWSFLKSTPIVMDIINRYNIKKTNNILEIGCGEGRDAKVLLENNFNLLAIDISEEAINYCKNNYYEYKDNFKIMDCLSSSIDDIYDFIYSIAVIHMLVEEEDRDKYYKFVYDHLKDQGIALVCSMGDGEYEIKTNPEDAFKIQKREHYSGEIEVVATSCRMVSFKFFEEEIKRNGLEIIEKGITNNEPNFNKLMYAVIKKPSLTNK